MHLSFGSRLLTCLLVVGLVVAGCPWSACACAAHARAEAAGALDTGGAPGSASCPMHAGHAQPGAVRVAHTAPVPAAAHAGPQLAGPCCCDHEPAPAAAPAAVPAGGQEHGLWTTGLHLDGGTWTAIVVPAALPSRSVTWWSTGPAPPPPRAPLYLLKSSLLI